MTSPDQARERNRCYAISPTGSRCSFLLPHQEFPYHCSVLPDGERVRWRDDGTFVDVSNVPVPTPQPAEPQAGEPRLLGHLVYDREAGTSEYVPAGEPRAVECDGNRPECQCPGCVDAEPRAVPDGWEKLARRWGRQLSSLIRECHRALGTEGLDLVAAGYDSPSDIVLTLARGCAGEGEALREAATALLDKARAMGVGYNGLLGDELRALCAALAAEGGSER